MQLCLKVLCAKAFCAQCFLCKRLLSDSKSFLACRTAETSWEKLFEEMSKVDQCPDWMKTVEKNLSRWHVRRGEMRWDEMRWGEVRCDELRRVHMIWDEMKCGEWSASVKCGVWRVQCEVWRKCLPGVALHRGRAQVMFLDNNRATGSHKARTGLAGVWRMQVL